MPEPEGNEELPSMEEVEANEAVESEEKEILTEDGSEDEDDSYLPSPDELGIDMSERK